MNGVELLYLGVFLAFIAVIVVAISNIRGGKNKTKPVNKDAVEDDMEGFDIVQTPNGMYVPMYKGGYLFITVDGSAKLHDRPSGYHMYRNKKDALKCITQWKSYKGIGTKSVGLKLD